MGCDTNSLSSPAGRDSGLWELAQECILSWLLPLPVTLPYSQSTLFITYQINYLHFQILVSGLLLGEPKRREKHRNNSISLFALWARYWAISHIFPN